MNERNRFIKHDIKIMDAFIDKFARQYIEQRSQTNTDLSSLSNNQIFKTSGFDTALLEGIISKNSVAYDFNREKGLARLPLCNALLICFKLSVLKQWKLRAR